MSIESQIYDWFNNQRNVDCLFKFISKKVPYQYVDDIISDTCIRAMQSGTYNGSSSISTWIHTIAINLSRDYLRKLQNGKSNINYSYVPLEQVDEVLLSKETSPYEKLLRKINEQQFDILKSTLNPQQLSILELKLQGCEGQEIAEKLDIPLGTVKGTIYKIKHKFAHEYTS